MKVSEVNLLIFVLVFIHFSGYAQSDPNMSNSSITIPLKIGKNPRTVFEELVIEPANLFIQSKPLNNNSPHFQLELNVFNNETKYSTFLWCYNAYTDNQQTNYPKSYQDYSFALKINKMEVALVVEKLDFGKSMFLDFGQTVVIAKLEILFKDCISEWSEDINGNQTAGLNSYTISLSEEGEQKSVSFMSLNKLIDQELIIEWKNYEILILEDSEKVLKLIVHKNDS